MRHSPETPSYDAFGEPIGADRVAASDAGDRRARNAALAIFWTLAVLLTAGRVYTQVPIAQPMQLAAR